MLTICIFAAGVRSVALICLIFCMIGVYIFSLHALESIYFILNTVNHLTDNLSLRLMTRYVMEIMNSIAWDIGNRLAICILRLRLNTHLVRISRWWLEFTTEVIRRLARKKNYLSSVTCACGKSQYHLDANTQPVSTRLIIFTSASPRWTCRAYCRSQV